MIEDMMNIFNNNNRERELALYEHMTNTTWQNVIDLFLENSEKFKKQRALVEKFINHHRLYCVGALLSAAMMKMYLEKLINMENENEKKE